MSYASVTSHNVPPPSQQPHPDPSLLNTGPLSASNVADDGAKVNVVSSDFRSNPATFTSEAQITVNNDYEDITGTRPGSNRNKFKKDAKKGFREAEAEGEYVWEVTKQYLLRPGVAGGLIGLVNIGIIAGVGHAYYTQPHLRRDTAIVGSTVVGALALLGAEGYVAEKYRETPSGREEERRAREEGALIYRHAREIVLRPGVLGGLVGLINTAILGTIGYYGYINWDKPLWDRRTVSAISVGLVTLWAGEGYFAQHYSDSRH